MSRFSYLPFALSCAQALMALVCAPLLHAASVHTGWSHNFVIRDDATVWGWGANSYGQLGNGSTQPPSAPAPIIGLSNIAMLAGGFAHTVAVHIDGSVLSWGDNEFAQLGSGTTSPRFTPGSVAGLSKITHVATGREHSLARASDGSIWMWGRNDRGQLGDGTTTMHSLPIKLDGISDVVQVAGGENHSVALKKDGTVWAWGDNLYGQVGDGTFVMRTVPTQVQKLSSIVAISSRLTHTLALRNDGTVWAWGYNRFGQLGYAGADSHVPVQVMPLAGIRQIGVGGNSSFAAGSDGTVWAWGSNHYGERGVGSDVPHSPTPVQVPGASGTRVLRAGLWHAMALKDDGSIVAWGNNSEGELGTGHIASAPAPVPVASLGTVTATALSRTSGYALRGDGTVVAWGDNEWGQLGDGSTTSRSAPAPVRNLAGIRELAGGYLHAIAAAEDGSVWSWGADFFGQLGGGTTNVSVGRTTPARVQNLTGVSRIAAGLDHNLALKSDGTVWAWGWNDYGQLGDGTMQLRALPVQVGTLTGIIAIAAGGHHSMALAADGSVWAWGAATVSLSNRASGTRVLSPARVAQLSGAQAIADGGLHALALTNDGTVWTWGNNGYGQLGDGTTTSRVTPALVAGLASIRSIAAGYTHSMVIDAAGNAWVWGNGGALGDGSGLNAPRPKRLAYAGPLSRAAAADGNTLAVMKDGSLIGWGNNAYQSLGIAYGTQSSVPIAVKDVAAAYGGADLVVEYFNPSLKNAAGTQGIGHYFLTASTPEVVSIDRGGSGDGWGRTGRAFRAWKDRAKAPAAAMPVCRFYAQVPNSHFYTANPTECDLLRSVNPTNSPALGWSFEEIAFHTVLPDGDQHALSWRGSMCPVGYFPVYRAYNDRFTIDPKRTDTNHRMTTSFSDYQRAVRFLGYVEEGIRFCSPASTQPGGDLQMTLTYPGARVTAGSTITAEYLINNNGPGSSSGGTVYIALPIEVSNWAVACEGRQRAACPAGLTGDQLRRGVSIAQWPAGGGLTITATGTAPAVQTGSDAALVFGGTVTPPGGGPDIYPANNTPADTISVVKAKAACNVVPASKSLQLGPDAQTAQLPLVIGDECAWSAQSDQNWLSVTPPAGSGDTTLTLTLDENRSIETRTASLTINGRQVPVAQSGIPCTLIANPSSLTFTSGQQSRTISVTLPAGCTWSALSNSPWLSVAQAQRSGSGTVQVTVDANVAASARIGTIKLGAIAIEASQSGAIEAAVTPASPHDACASLKLHREGDQVAAAGLIGDQTFGVSAEAECAWRAQASVSWITLHAGSGSRGNGTVAYVVAPNDTPDVRHGAIVIGERAFVVNQAKASADSGGGNDGGSDGGGGGSGDGDGGSGSGGGSG